MFSTFLEVKDHYLCESVQMAIVGCCRILKEIPSKNTVNSTKSSRQYLCVDWQMLVTADVALSFW